MKHKLFILGALFLLLTVTSCRQESDALYSYGQNDDLRFQEANESYAGEFKLFWHAMNQNYPLWDYEREFGFDWDAAYDAFLPRFEALDQRLENGEEITDEEYQSLLEDLWKTLCAPYMIAICLPFLRITPQVMISLSILLYCLSTIVKTSCIAYLRS